LPDETASGVRYEIIAGEHWMRAVEESGYVAAQRSVISSIE
jgi:ParB-like chromosome segregation protein Spo0J